MGTFSTDAHWTAQSHLAATQPADRNVRADRGGADSADYHSGGFGRLHSGRQDRDLSGAERPGSASKFLAVCFGRTDASEARRSSGADASNGRNLHQAL